MRGLEQVRRIHLAMNPQERAVLRAYLDCFETRKKGHKPQSLVLLDLLEKHTDDEKLMKLFKKKVSSQDARRMILFRLREKMTASMALDVNLSRKEVYSDRARACLKIRSEGILGRTLALRGQRKSGMDLIERLISLAKKYELYDDLITLLYEKRAISIGVQLHMDDIDNEIDHYAKCRDGAHQADRYFESVRAKYGFKGGDRASTDPEQIKFLKSRIDELFDIFESTSSATVGYRYYYLLVEYHQMTGQLEQASTSLKELLTMLENNPAIYNRFKMMSVMADLAGNTLRLYQFDEAERWLSEPLTNSRPNSVNWSIRTELAFYAQFYADRMDEAFATLDEVLENQYLDQSEFQKATRKYLLGCTRFVQGRLDEVGTFLFNTHEMDTDKEGWNLGSRQLSILLAIEQEKFDYADSLIANLRQFMREGLKGITVRKRDKLILEILWELRKNSYDFKKTHASKADSIALLWADNRETGWTVQTPEMICFHTWLEDKLHDRAYRPIYTKAHLFRTVEV